MRLGIAASPEASRVFRIWLVTVLRQVLQKDESVLR